MFAGSQFVRSWGTAPNEAQNSRNTRKNSHDANSRLIFEVHLPLIYTIANVLASLDCTAVKFDIARDLLLYILGHNAAQNGSHYCTAVTDVLSLIAQEFRASQVRDFTSFYCA